uniref:hypothetical protein n=1 Tax=Enterobacter cloacae complex sp. 280C5 TaxID=3395861 RepID=UPI003CFB4A75
MRVSEIFELHVDSFHTYTINGQDFHSVSAATHKLAAGKKNEEWLASPIVEKAISLATALSACAREQLLKIAVHSNDPGQSDTLLDSRKSVAQPVPKKKPACPHFTKQVERPFKKFFQTCGCYC